jgi:hypothetical protein
MPSLLGGAKFLPAGRHVIAGGFEIVKIRYRWI